ncbi:MAG: hypothetical protein V3R77_04110 [Candidatus Binatia bacterium]
MSALADVADVLERNGIAHALIGAAALAVHGLARATADIDLLSADVVCLNDDMWNSLRTAGYSVECRRGDADDPLAGVVRAESSDGETVDVIVGRDAWQRPALARAVTHRIGDADVPVVSAGDLVRLKLFAGGPQDAWDIDQLLDLDPELEQQVIAALHELPTDAVKLWETILVRRRGG